ncbi:YihY/virulence factor BrkB family protein [Actinomadura rugatobispora]|uniref:YihY/virulence factor BrkB family protein n=1 Tax=Actinomadura rugatobispora TaxID=1994 RepID=A0ABW1A1N1_9ACTN|nr:YihY/virulence factor BrkB family protein [Actinomadura rugatobispora]
MRQLIGRAWGRIEASWEAGERLLRAGRARWPWLDHLGRAYGRYQDRRGDRLAAALTCYGFLSFFPLLALAYALLGYLLGVSDEARAYFVQAVEDLLPGLKDRLQVEQIASSKTAVGLVGLVALLFTGLGFVQMLREALRDIWDNPPQPEGNFLVMRVRDAGVLLFLGAMLITGVAVSTVTGSATHTVLGWLGWDEVPGAGVALRLLSLAVAIAFDAVVFLVLFSRLSGTRAPWRTIYRGALFGALGFELLKQVAAFLLDRVTSNPVYASFAVLVGLMIWINIVSRFLMFTAAWTATRRAVLSADATTDSADGGSADGGSDGDSAARDPEGPGGEAGRSGPEDRSAAVRPAPAQDEQPARDERPARDGRRRREPRGQDQKASSAY